MSSSLTFQLRQQHDKCQLLSGNGLPSPPNSSYDEAGVSAGSAHCAFQKNDYTVDRHHDNSCDSNSSDSRSTSGNSGSGRTSLAESSLEDQHGHGDSLPTHFNAMTLQYYSTSLPENYTIDHSSPIPIQSAHKQHPTSPHSSHQHFSLSPASSTAIAAGTGGRTIRNGRRSAEPGLLAPSASSLGRKSRVTSESHKYTQTHRCEECGKVYKHASCLAKHRWEHSEEWELTSKLLLTKHQQVQMLEAAAILVSMDPKSSEHRHPSNPSLYRHHHSPHPSDIPSSMSEHVISDDDDDTASIVIDDDSEPEHSVAPRSPADETFILDDD